MPKKTTAKNETAKAEATAAPDAEKAPKPGTKRKSAKDEAGAEARGPVVTPTQPPPVLSDAPQEKPGPAKKQGDRYDAAMRILDEYYEGTPPRDPGHYHDED